ncbi:transposase [Deinococcus detaillensis]|uniref:Transposase n=1 Tax=Deinococcus detaillensis TaxID=2592048 RepID=A0A553UEQ2_9DEIO|nr:transposase [Deinococcus detaillensis]TSA78697.1 transposase [Deinococcus detaillensis]
MKYLDQSGFSLMLSVASTWFKRGSGQQFRIPTRWGSQGRLNLIGTYSFQGELPQLEVRALTGSCTQAQVMAYLDTLAEQCEPERLTVIVLDNTAFHRGKAVQEKRVEWEAQGLYLRYLPPYAPFLNLIEGVWKQIKGFLMPRLSYNSLAELEAALRVALNAISARFI